MLDHNTAVLSPMGKLIYVFDHSTNNILLVLEHGQLALRLLMVIV